MVPEHQKKENTAHTFLCFAKAQLSDDLKTQNLHSYGIRPLQATAVYYNYVRGADKYFYPKGKIQSMFRIRMFY